MRTHRSLLTLFLFALGCSDDIYLLEKTEGVFDSSGGTLKSADGRLTLTIPAGALSRNTAITIETVRDIEVQGLLSRAYELPVAALELRSERQSHRAARR